MKVAKVIVDVPVDQTDRTFDYFVPEKLNGIVSPGVRVVVPFAGRRLLGFVIEITDHSDFDRLKHVEEVLDFIPVLTEELLSLGKWLSEKTLCFQISAYQAMLPKVFKAKYEKEFWLAADFEQLPEELKPLFLHREVITMKDVDEAKVSYSLLQRCIQKGLIDVKHNVYRKETKKHITVLSLAKEQDVILEEIESLPSQASKQKKILSWFLQQKERVSYQEVQNANHTTRSTIKSLVEKGLLKEKKEEIYRDPYEGREFEQTQPFVLTQEQETVIIPIKQAIQENQSETFLLHGVTGSGKTEVYLQSIQMVIDKGKEAIVLVPEIALTPLMVERFKGRFGPYVAVLHSALSDGEKYDEWRKIQKKEVKVVVGARSAIFAPFDNIGLIILDEEHEGTYKQEDHPRYHARDVAIERASYHKCPVVLGSATPLMESYARAKKGVYRLLTLSKRMNDQQMPAVEIIDMRDELHQGNRTMFSRSLMEKMKDRIQKREQIVLFLNRRGYSTFVMCRDCGHTLECPHCDISLTFHRENSQLKCHYCGYEERMPQKCPSCQEEQIRFFGTGTEKVEEALYQQLPHARVIRMDVDTTRRKGAHEKLLTKFGNEEADILLGTQMIAKGLDFKKVTLVGVLAADLSLHLPDFRASEKTFQLLTQVSGRAGRHDLPGEVIIQSYNPEHYSIELASQHDYLSYFLKEMQVRKLVEYPPYYFLALITVSHKNQIYAQRKTEEIVLLLQKHLSDTTKILGPTPSPLSRVKDRYRFQCMIKYKNEPNLEGKMRKVIQRFEEEMRKKDLIITVDLQPYQMM
ncbi:primosomal protein N' [Bacillaceae bacterium S4-13-56]